ncbi:hypothetical protein BDZ94DRAFT_1273516 [Collybia nuda]|uniref:Uncharacterized protein n=1 Tax=Collybia nuda TaxID=64659 RepID=A0A9P6C9M5_9AGAR|nr:hypothetical protein BDZ94DRAFT_1273516 [Collybia nuda]
MSKERKKGLATGTRLLSGGPCVWRRGELRGGSEDWIVVGLSFSFFLNCRNFREQGSSERSGGSSGRVVRGQQESRDSRRYPCGGG